MSFSEENCPSSNKQESVESKLELIPQGMPVGMPHQAAIWGRSVGVRNGVAPMQKNRTNGAYQQESEFQAEDYDDIEVCNMSSPDTGEECDYFGKSVAAQLKMMNYTQKCLAQRLISEICFRGQMQILQLSTTFATQASSYQPPQQQQPTFCPRTATPGFNRDFVHQQASRPHSQQQ